MAMPTYPAAKMAKLLQITPRRLQQLVSEGVIPKISRGRYELAPVVQGYIGYLRDRTLPGIMNVVSLDEARQRKLAAEAKLAEIEVAKAESGVVNVEIIEKSWTDLVHAVRGRLLALPQNVAAMVAVEDDTGKCEALINREIRSALAELGDGKLPDIEERPGEPDESAGAGDESVAAAAGPKRKRMGRPRKGTVAGS